MLPIVEDPRLERYVDPFVEGENGLLMMWQEPARLWEIGGWRFDKSQPADDEAVVDLLRAARREYGDMTTTQRESFMRDDLRIELIRLSKRDGKLSVKRVWSMLDSIMLGENPLSPRSFVVSLPMGKFLVTHPQAGAVELMDLYEPELVGYLGSLEPLRSYYAANGARSVHPYSIRVWPDYLEIPTDSCTMRELCQRAHSYKLVYKRASSHLDGDSRKLILEGRP